MPFQPIDELNYPAVAQIYKQGIDSGHATFETEILDWQSWDRTHLPYGRIVYEENNTIFGWASLAPVSGRCAYTGVAEVSIYVRDIFQGKGIGKNLLEKLINISESNGIWTLHANVFRENTASLILCRKSGFRDVGPKVGKVNL